MIGLTPGLSYRPPEGALFGAAPGGPTMPPPVMLQQRAFGNTRHHALRMAVRLLVLLVADVTSLVTATLVIVAVWKGAEAGGAVSSPFVGTLAANAFHPVEAITALLCGIFLLGNYRAGDKRRDLAALLAGTGLGLLLLFWRPLWADFAGGVAVYLFGLAWFGAAVVAGRLLIDRLVRARRPDDQGMGRVLLVGTSKDVRATLERHLPERRAPLRPVGYVSVGAARAVDALGGTADLPTVIHAHAVNTVLLCGRLGDGQFAEIVRLADAAGCRVVSMSRPYLLSGLDPQIVWHGGTPLVELTRPSLRGSHLIMKRAFDIVAAAAALIAAAPVCLAVAVAVRLSSPGSILFRQLRVGYGGRRFYMYKFRSMHSDAEARLSELQSQSDYDDPRLFKMKRDPRVTRVGAFLRRTSLDEIPQLWNVLRGEMSLVGPRPPLVREVALYEEKLYGRFDMKPGITGPWQVSGRNRITSFERVIEIETAYMRGWTLWRDFGILLRTLPAVLRMDGAR